MYRGNYFYFLERKRETDIELYRKRRREEIERRKKIDKVMIN